MSESGSTEEPTQVEATVGAQETVSETSDEKKAQEQQGVVEKELSDQLEEIKVETEEHKELQTDPDKNPSTETAVLKVQENKDTEAVAASVASPDPPTASKSDDSSHVFSEGWSQLPRDVIVDKIKGVVYGQAIGDALGLATEFMDRKMAKGYYGKKGPSGYSDIAQDFHRSRWQRGDWTDDTDQMLLILLMIVESGGRVDCLDFARRIHNWMQHGFKELGDIGGMGIGMTVKKTLTHDRFLKEPQEAAKDVWEQSNRYLAANGAIMRTSILGVLNFNDISKVVSNTVEITRVTHADPRCSASCIAVTTAIALMLQGKYDPGNKRQLNSLIDAALMEANKVLESKDHKHEMKHHVTASLDKLKLDDKNSIGYTFKALGAGFWGLRNVKDFRKTLLEVIMQAGDADSNASVCGALMGCKVGFSQLPDDLLQFPHRQWLDQRVDSFLEVIGLKEKTTDAQDT